MPHAKPILALFALLLGVVPCRADLPPTHYRGSRLVSAWLPYWTNLNGTGIGWRSIQAHAQFIDEVSFFAWSVEPASGDLKPAERGLDEGPLVDQIAWLHARDVAALFTVTLFGSVHETLNNPAVLAHLTEEIVRVAADHQFDGVDIDFEEFKAGDAADAPLYTAFLDGVAKAMHDRRDVNGYPKLAIATVLPRTTRDKFGYTDEEAIARSGIDRVRVMAYDDFYPGSKTAGACAPLPWVVGVGSLLAGLSAPSGKFILGVPGYGYQWPVANANDPTALAKGKSITFPQADALIAQHRATTKWDEQSGTERITYTQSNPPQTWLGYFEDSRSWAAKIDRVVLPSRLGGLCEWAAGYEDPDAWEMLAGRLALPYPVYGAIGVCYARNGGGAVLGAPLGAAEPMGSIDDALPHGRTEIEQRFERGVIHYKWGEWCAELWN